MSYDLYLFKPRPGIEPSITAEALFARDSDELDKDVASPIEWHSRRAIASALIKQNPRFDVFPSELAGALAATEGSAMEEPAEYIELSDTEDDTGIQVSVFEEEISVTVPYWHSGEAAEAVFHKVWKYLEAIQRIAGCHTYDPQLGRLVNLNTDFNDVVSVYTSAMTQLEDDIER